MKLNLAQLENHLTAKILPVYLVSSDEVFLKQEAFNLIRKAAKKLNFNERVRFIPESNAQETLFNLLHAVSFLNDKKLIELDFVSQLPTKELQKILKDYAENPNKDNILLIDLAKLDSKVSKVGWFTQLEKIGALITIWPMAFTELPQWILARAKKYQLNMNLSSATYLAEYVEGNLLAAAQAIEKLYLLNTDSIDHDILRQIMTDECRYSLFDLVDNMIAGRAKEALHILQSLQAEDVEPVLILWAIVRELRILIELSCQLEKGEQLEFLFKKYRIFFKREHSVKSFLKRFSREDCGRHLERAHHIDKIIKGAIPGNPWHAMQILCLSLV